MKGKTSMKTLSIILLLIAISIIGYSQIFTFENYGKWEEVTSECTICSKTLHTYVEVKEPEYREFDYGMDIDPGFGNFWNKNNRPTVPDSVRPTTLQFPGYTIDNVCQKCEAQYKNEWQKKSNELFEELKADAMKDHTSDRIQWAEFRKRDIIKKAKDAVEKAKQELRWLEHPEERPKQDTLRFYKHSIGIDSVECSVYGSLYINNWRDSLIVTPDSVVMRNLIESIELYKQTHKSNTK